MNAQTITADQALSLLISEGYARNDVEATVDAAIAAGAEHDDNGDPVFLPEDVEVLREQLLLDRASVLASTEAPADLARLADALRGAGFQDGPALSAEAFAALITEEREAWAIYNEALVVAENADAAVFDALRRQANTEAETAALDVAASAVFEARCVFDAARRAASSAWTANTTTNTTTPR